MSNENDHLNAYIDKLTSAPGIYKMYDSQGQVLYVGKASNLKKRVSSYFNKQQNSAKTQALVKQIASIEVIVTETETEALLLECTLIKTLLPKYNVLLRDDKSYPYIHISNHRFPLMESYRSKRKPQKGLYFGPFPSAGLVRETINILQKVFKIRNCSNHFFNARTRPCLQYQLHRCTAPCVGFITEADYQKSVESAIQFLQGKSTLIVTALSKRMDSAVQKLAFEEAAFFRDQIKNLKKLQEQQRMIQLHGEADVLVLTLSQQLAIVLCVSIRDGQVLSSQSFFPIIPKDPFPDDNLEEQILNAFVSHYYLDNPERIPPLILLEKNYTLTASLSTLLTKLRKKNCRIEVPLRGKKGEWLAFAKTNLAHILAQQLDKTEKRALRFEALKTLVQWENPINRMECFDISHTQGQAPVASCVVFDAHGPLKRDYRQFNIQNITAGDDYGAMEQALLRRYKRLLEENKDLPDLIIIDGGTGQISAAQKALAQLGISDRCLIGIAKGASRKPGLEEIILVAQRIKLRLDPGSEALHLLQEIRDEAHRFALKSHRAKRSKETLSSSLTAIEGIGPKRRQALLRHFGGLQGLRAAKLEDLAKVPGLSLSLAKKVYESLRE